MNFLKRCPISYELIDEAPKYSKKGLKLLSPRLSELNDLPFSTEELKQEAINRSTKMSVQGVQNKVSAILNIPGHCFELVDAGGNFILKLSSDNYPELPQNEDLTMRLAKMVGIDVPLHGMLYAKEGSLIYFIKRFDRPNKKIRLNVEDFAQLSLQTRDTKYQSSMEKVIDIILKNCTFPQIEKQKLFLITVFNFLIGNEDMHLKNFSLITKENIITLSPAYDLLNTTIAIKNAKEQIALPLNGRKNNLRAKDFKIYLAQDQLELPEAVINKTLHIIENNITAWQALIRNSFLSPPMQEKYLSLLQQRVDILF